MNPNPAPLKNSPLSYLEDTTAIRYPVKEKAIPTVSCELTSSPLSINILLSCFQLNARLEIQNWFFLGARAFFRAEIGRARARARPTADRPFYTSSGAAVR